MKPANPALTPPPSADQSYTKDGVLRMAQWIDSWKSFCTTDEPNSAKAFDRCAAMLRAYAGVAEGWRPIESAPLAGTRVFTCFNGADVQINHYNDPSRVKCGYGLGKKGWWCSRPTQEPTHWMPIPPLAPTLSTQEVADG